ncbi:MAG: membrane protein insertase YidC [Muribaculaceae bacterium]|nr:membrane protein insertase YidC [Muribaculaceae bacterium]
MDKNTIIGLLLMAAVFFGFMWFAPKDKIEIPEEPENTGLTEQVVPDSAIDSLSPTEMKWLVRNIIDHGTSVTAADSAFRADYSNSLINLSTDGKSVTGSVIVDGDTLNWKDVESADLSKMTPLQQRKAIEIVRAASSEIGRYGKFAPFLSGNDTVIKLENDVLALELSSKSGSITRAELKKYDTEYTPDETKKRKEKVVIFENATNSLSFLIPLSQEISTTDLYFRASIENDSTVLMTLPIAEDAYWGIEYTLPRGDSYVVGMKVVQKNMSHYIESNNRNLGIDWRQELIRQEKGKMFEERNSALYYKFAGGSVQNLSENKNDSEDRQAKIRWIGFKNQFFSSVLISDRPFNTADFQSKVLKDNPIYLKDFSTQATVNDYDWNTDVPARFSFFIGPNLYPLLSSLDHQTVADENLQMTRLIPLGWSVFRWINTGVIIPIFNFLGSFISNYGIVILVMTFFIKLVLFPLTYKSYRSQAVMRLLQPEVKEINEKYPGQQNAMVRQQKMMALYSRAGASPMSGCLPMLLQMPILFAMFTFFPSAIELRGQSFLWAHDLAAPDAIISWSGHIPLITDYFGNHISLFCLLMTITNIVYTRINMQTSGNQMPGMKWMMYLMPVFFMIFFNNYAAGLSYYYFLSLLITIAQTYAFRYIIKEEDVRKKMAENAKKPRKKSGFMARLEEMQKQQQAMMREQQKRAQSRR